MRWLPLLLVACSESSLPLDPTDAGGVDMGFADSGEPDAAEPDAGASLPICTPEYAHGQAVGGGEQPSIAGRLRGSDGRFIVALAQATTYQLGTNPPVESTIAQTIFFRERTSEVGIDLATGPLDELVAVLHYDGGFAIAMTGAITHGATRPQGTFTLLFENDAYHMGHWIELDPGVEMIDAVSSSQGIINVLRRPGQEPGPVFLRMADATEYRATYESESDALDFDVDSNGHVLISELRSESIVLSRVDPITWDFVNPLGSVPACSASSHRMHYQDGAMLVVLDCADRVELISVAIDPIAVQWTAIVHEGPRGPTASQLARSGDVVSVAVQDETMELAAHFFRTDGTRASSGIHPIDTNTSLPFAYDFTAVDDTFALLLTTLGQTTAIHELVRFSACPL
jgi:hypothetical protein